MPPYTLISQLTFIAVSGTKLLTSPKSDLAIGRNISRNSRSRIILESSAPNDISSSQNSSSVRSSALIFFILSDAHMSGDEDVKNSFSTCIPYCVSRQYAVRYASIPPMLCPVNTIGLSSNPLSSAANSCAASSSEEVKRSSILTPRPGSSTG